jgi:SSS family solute:Na+ symporter
VVMLFSTLMSDELALLARVSFTGTAMMAPVVLMAVISKRRPARGIILISFLAFVTYLLSVLGVVPDFVGKLRLDLFLYLVLIVSSIIYSRISSSSEVMDSSRVG